MSTPTLRGGASLTSEINVTPMIDVLLVLLITFMASLPNLHRPALDVNLPVPRPDRAAGGSASIVLEIDDAGHLFLNTQPVPSRALAARLHAAYDGRPDKVLFVKGSRHVKYDTVLHAMDVARGAGVQVLGLP